MFNNRLIVHLQDRVASLSEQVVERDKQIRDLIERLLRKEAVPPTIEKQRQDDLSGMDAWMKKMDIFDDVDQPEEETNEIGEFVKE